MDKLIELLAVVNYVKVYEAESRFYLEVNPLRPARNEMHYYDGETLEECIEEALLAEA